MTHDSTKQLKRNRSTPRLISSTYVPPDTQIKITLVTRPLLKSSAGANMVYSRAERMFILEHYFTWKCFNSVREALSNVYPGKETTVQDNAPIDDNIF
jgi:hypothetical protein